MTRLIVDDGGQRRAFKIQDGRLTVGSGPDAGLRLNAGDVADLHLDLEVEGGRVKVRARPGVTAPLVDGRPVAGAIELAHGAALKVGSATLRVEYEGAAAAVAAAPRPVRAGVPKRPKSVVESRRAPAQRGLPGWAIASIALAVVGVGGFLGSKVLTAEPTNDLSTSAIIEHAQRDMRSGQIFAAETRLNAIERDKLDPGTLAQHDAALAELAQAKAETDQALINIGGTQYLQSQLRKFEEQRLAGKAERPEVRVFLKRCASFLQRWPTHPESDWVKRMQERYAPLYDLASKPSFEDIAFEAESLTWANPRDYKQAFEAVRGFADDETTTADDRAKALKLLDDLTAQRAEWFADRMQQARYEYDKGQIGKSVEWLVMLIVYTGDAGMAAQASEQLVKFEGLAEWLRGYRTSYPDKYAILKQQPVIAKYIADHAVEQTQAP